MRWSGWTDSNRRPLFRSWCAIRTGLITQCAAMDNAPSSRDKNRLRKRIFFLSIHPILRKRKRQGIQHRVSLMIALHGSSWLSNNFGPFSKLYLPSQFQILRNVRIHYEYDHLYQIQLLTWENCLNSHFWKPSKSIHLNHSGVADSMMKPFRSNKKLIPFLCTVTLPPLNDVTWSYSSCISINPL